MVADLVMPIVALVLPSGDWRKSGMVLKHAANEKDNVVLNYGDFIGSVLDFFVVALVLFIVVSRLIAAAENRFAHKDAAPPAVKECPACCETVPAKATRCKYCTSELKAA